LPSRSIRYQSRVFGQAISPFRFQIIAEAVGTDGPSRFHSMDTARISLPNVVSVMLTLDPSDSREASRHNNERIANT
ncbi:MAG: hypothetical protein VX757_11840, partial [Planctomycetota bacterium]|nr:hypothetical protein [Planctomycetota bacterium]